MIRADAIGPQRARDSVRRIGALGRHEFRVARTDLDSMVLLAVVPLVAMAFAKPLFGVFLQHEGYKGANGSEQAVPGFAILFGLYLPAYIAISFFREHGQHTWVRLRASELRMTETVTAKLLVWLVIGVVQQVTLFVGGWLLLGFHVKGSIAALSIVAASFVLDMGALGILLVGLCRTTNQVWTVGTTGSLVLAGLGGAIIPVASLPHWAATIAPAMPSYWAMRGYRSVILQSGGLVSVLLDVFVLAVFTSGFFLVGVLRLRRDETKEY
jgi:ABC-2 type transport system permease protein